MANGFIFVTMHHKGFETRHGVAPLLQLFYPQ